MIRRAGLTAACIAAGLTAPGLAQDTPTPSPDVAGSIQQTDGTGNGAGMGAKAQAARAVRINSLDTDANGKIDAQELSARFMQNAKERSEARAATIVKRLDVNGDEQLSAAELAVPLMADDRIDSDRDGPMSKQEVRAARDRKMGHRAGTHGHCHDEWKRKHGPDGASKPHHEENR